MKTYFRMFAVAAAMLLCACSRMETGEEAVQQSDTREPLSFGAYVSRSATRAGDLGEVTVEMLKKNVGFGVMTTYTGLRSYFQHPGGANFMYNEWVQWDFDNFVWAYDPLKYWPIGLANAETGVVSYERLSIFSYAPYVAVHEDTGLVTDGSTEGIIGMNRLTEDGDPHIYFTVPMNMARQVDLCWGTSDGEQTVGETTVPDGMPLLDLTRHEGTVGNVNIRFHHALSQLRVGIQLMIDGVPSMELSKDTHVFIRSVSFTGFALSGVLNLRNTVAFTPRWTDFHGLPLSNNTVTFHDGRMDGFEGGGDYGANTAEENQLLNEQLIEVQVSPFQNQGVTNITTNLFRQYDPTAPIAPLYVIPTGGGMDITVEYDIETVDEKLKGHYLSDGVTRGHVSHNRVTRRNVFPRMLAGKAYNVSLRLSLTELMLDASVEDWAMESESY